MLIALENSIGFSRYCNDLADDFAYISAPPQSSETELISTKLEHDVVGCTVRYFNSDPTGFSVVPTR